jgi:glycosyltransferase involved in cell wall biosynthesis
MAPIPRLLDLTRLLTRAGRGPLTGIDRVEAAYLDRFLADPGPAYFLASTARRVLILEKPAALSFRERLMGRLPWGGPDLLARLKLGLPQARRIAEASLRRGAMETASLAGLGQMLKRRFPDGAEYYNVGHSNLSEAMFAAIRGGGLGSAVLVHDSIPLDRPALARQDTVPVFEARMRAVSAHADRVIYVSDAARGAAERHFARMGRVPPGHVAPLGVNRPVPDPGALPAGLPPPSPFFVALGTIEPRKNHALLLDIWEHFHKTLPETDIPRLVIAGGRGWEGADFFRRLDAVPFRERTLFEHNRLSDGAVAALLESAAGLVFPSLAEGYGLPPIEALSLGTPVIAAPLPVYRETLGDFAIYANPGDLYDWAKRIRELAQGDPGRARRQQAFAPPSWKAHFEAALGMPKQRSAE